MRRGYVRKVPGLPVDKQREDLSEIRPVYADAAPAEAIASLRAGDELAIAGDLRILGSNREAIRAVVNAVRAKGASIVDVTTGRTVSDDGAEMMAEAIKLIAGEKVRHIDHAAAAQKRWGKPTRLPYAQARKIWFDKALTVREALARMPGWSSGNAYRYLGARGKFPGRPKGKTE